MSCGGCGGGDIRIAPKRSVPAIPREEPIGIQRKLRPMPVSRMVSTMSSSKREGKRVKLPEFTKIAKNRAENVRLCLVCGASLSIEITGRTLRKRFRCKQCHKIYI